MRGDDVDLGMGKFVDASTGAAELKAASRSSSSVDCGMDCGGGRVAGLWVRPCSRLSQNCEFWPPYCDSNWLWFSAAFFAFSSCCRFCCSMRERFLLLDAEELNETRFAKLSPVDGTGFAGELDRIEVADRGVDLPELPAGRTFGNIKPDPMGGGLLAGVLELDDQLRPLRSSIAGKVVRNAA